MRGRRTFLRLILVMVAVEVVVGTLALTLLYRASFDQQRERLTEVVRSRARLMEAIARFDIEYSADVPGGSFDATLYQIRQAHMRFEGFGQTGEFTLAKREADQIAFLLDHRHGGLASPAPVGFSSSLAEPMRRALLGQSGTVVGPDYRGETVLAAYEPVGALDLGVVAKIDLAEVRSPFVRAGVWSAAVGLLLTLFGAAAFQRIGQPLMQAIEENERRYRGLFESAPDALLLVDHAGTILDANPAAGSVFGRRVEDLSGQVAFGFVHPDHADVIKNAARGLNSDAPFRSETVCLGAGDVEFHADISLAPTAHEDGVATRMTIRDITERKRAEDALSAAHELLNTVLSSTPDAIFAKDQRGVYLLANDAVAEVVGAPAGEIIGKDDHAIRPREEADEIRKTDETVMLNGQLDTEEHVVGPDGDTRTYHAVKTPIHNAQGDVNGLVGVARDITDRKRAEEEIRQLNADLEERVRQRTSELEESNSELEAFGYYVSHDLRAPLRGINGFSDMLMEKPDMQLDAEANHYLSLVKEHAEQMGRLIDDLLQFSRLSRQPVDRQSVDPAELAREAWRGLHWQIDGRDIDLTISDLPSCSADQAMLRQVFQNLLENAVKFTRERDDARIEVGAYVEDEETVYFVKDNGVGFDITYADIVFEVFQHLQRAEDYEGTSVGLALTQRIVHRHGGQIWAVSEVDHGATFFFTV
ncbi:PAS domain S-box protein [Candidatus Poribacteria bacterium]|jgi:PAS domain S-box-containing protein|nr:PAS domain S-box protein [Candidatus Poribacteria bacterium]MBT5535120.1 PAS domain S-box protein [Candidatus Poribacteria bacterium]MBT5709774.1 PAS domain S-box protein [Candidatus Poribacteria bacterium]MBT7097009.1 PAS domain S-box protein [Candidatus Poribacteria bacterium]MBT7805756.1 PAS domain S-box protein [Candidatus Poribacteria bacterium]